MPRRTILNRYYPMREAGVGGFATVQVAWDPVLRRRVAIKCIELATPIHPAGEERFRGFSPANETIPQEDTDDETSWSDVTEQAELRHIETAAIQAENFNPFESTPGLREARAVAFLSDPNIVTLHDFRVKDNMAYLIMEYVEGMSLADLLQKHNDDITLDMIAAVFQGVSHALEVAHANQVLHLDIKPANILISSQGQVKVTDFGLATLADVRGFGTAGGGTVGYMPLEQMHKQSLDARCDEWSLASIVYEMLTGKNPFTAPTLAQAEEAIEQADLMLPSLFWKDLDNSVDDTLFVALDPDPQERFSSVAEFAEALQPYLGDVKSGCRALSALVTGKPIEQAVQNDADPLPQRVSLRERIGFGRLTFAARIFAAAACGSIAYLCLANIPALAGVDSLLFWGVIVLFSLAGAALPHLGAALSFFALGTTFFSNGAFLTGSILIAATIIWWGFVGRLGVAPANLSLLFPVSGAIGLAQVSPLACGFVMRAPYACATAALGALLEAALASLGSKSMLSWNMFLYWQTGWQGSEITLGEVLYDPGTWCIIASWLLASCAVALLRNIDTKACSILGIILGGLILIAGMCTDAWFSSGGTSALPDILVVFSAVFSVICMLAANSFSAALSDESSS